MSAHWFWLLLTAACLVWYATITVYVAIRGGRDIREMLARLGRSNDAPPAEGSPEENHPRKP
jgi:hypothetical protein